MSVVLIRELHEPEMEVVPLVRRVLVARICEYPLEKKARAHTGGGWVIVDKIAPSGYQPDYAKTPLPSRDAYADVVRSYYEPRHDERPPRRAPRFFADVPVSWNSEYHWSGHY